MREYSTKGKAVQHGARYKISADFYVFRSSELFTEYKTCVSLLRDPPQRNARAHRAISGMRPKGPRDKGYASQLNPKRARVSGLGRPVSRSQPMASK